MWKQGAANCCGDHVLKYRINGFTGNNNMAFIHIQVKCPKPNCTSIDLSDHDPVGPIGQPQKKIYYACENSQVTYFVDYLPGNTYTWTVNGGTYIFPTPGNQSIIVATWNIVGSTTIQVVTNNGISNTTEIFCIDVLPAPVAGFTTTMNCVCLNSPISFTNTSTGASSYYWDFGDGNNSTMPNPTHNYALPGTYTVALYAYSSNYDPMGNPLCCCVDSIQMQILVDDLPGPNIYWVSTLCEGDSSKYWTDAVGCTYTWMVTDANNNAVPFTGNGNDTICVVWGSGPHGFVTLDLSNCGGTYCEKPVTVQVPIISSIANIAGESVVCVGSKETYTLPKWASVYYDWTVTGGMIVNGDGTHTVTIMWGSGPTGTIHVDYFSEFYRDFRDIVRKTAKVWQI
ncbi:MAG: PKD domain-containing protein [Saprospiraceae bacterium]|nr:PKD domain-containing protein [Saprospiraceae bacterium]